MTVYFPGGVFWLALRTRELELLVEAGLKEAFTPVGSPAAARLTVPLKPFSPTTRIVLLALVPAASTSELFEVLRLMDGDELDVANIDAPDEQPAIMASVEVRQNAPTSWNRHSFPWKLFNPRMDVVFVLSSRPVGSRCPM